jgi:hypothetical protein
MINGSKVINLHISDINLQRFVELGIFGHKELGGASRSKGRGLRAKHGTSRSTDKGLRAEGGASRSKGRGLRAKHGTSRSTDKDLRAEGGTSRSKGEGLSLELQR